MSRLKAACLLYATKKKISPLDESFGKVLQNNPDPDLINLRSVSRVTLHAANLKVAVI